MLAASERMPKGVSKNVLIQFEPFGPVVDGKDIPRNLLDGIEKLKKSDKNIIVGTNSIDGALYARSILPLNLPVSFALTVIPISFPQLAAGVRTLYAHSSGTKELLTNLITDYIFYCSSRRFADIFTLLDDQLWFYIFSQPLSFEAFGKHSGCMQSACHGGELPFLFSTLDKANHSVSEAEHSLSARMILYWANFAKYGNPNNQNDNLYWPKYDVHEKNESLLYFAETDRLKHNYRERFCQYFDKIGYHSDHLKNK